MIIQSTQRIIDNIRKVANQMDDILRRDLLDAASRLQDQSDLIERMRSELDQAISERTPHDYWILASQRDDYRDRLCASMKETQEALAEVERLEIINEEVLEANNTMGTTCAEPSRLEIAAMIYAAFAGAQCMKDKVNPTVYVAFKCADELIAAAKEVAK
jgi:hypothetical protein